MAIFKIVFVFRYDTMRTKTIQDFWCESSQMLFPGEELRLHLSTWWIVVGHLHLALNRTSFHQFFDNDN